MPITFDFGSTSNGATGSAVFCNFDGITGSLQIAFKSGAGVNGFASEADAQAATGGSWITMPGLSCYVDTLVPVNSTVWYAFRDSNNTGVVRTQAVTVIGGNVGVCGSCVGITSTTTTTRSPSTTTTSTSTTTQGPTVYPVKEFTPSSKGRSFVVRLRKGSTTGNIVANSKIITVDDTSSLAALADLFEDKTLAGRISTSNRLGFNQKNLSGSIVQGRGDYTEECFDEREFVDIIGSLSGVVYGGGNGTPYGQDSDIATAAVHAGLIEPGKRAIVRRQLVKFYSSTDPFQVNFQGNTNFLVTTLPRKYGCGFYFDALATIRITTTTTTSTTSTTTSTSSTTTTSTSTSTTSTTTTTTVSPGPSGLVRSTYWTSDFATRAATAADLLIERVVDQGPVLTGIRPAVSRNGAALDNPQGFYTVYWTGNFRPSTTETYTFSCSGVDDAFAMWIGSHTFTDNNANLSVALGGVNSYSIPLTAGTEYPIRLAYFSISGPQVFDFKYSTSTIPATNNLSGLIFNSGITGTPATATITPNKLTANEAEPISFTISTNGIPAGTNLAWWFNNVSSLDFNDNIGVYQPTTETGSNNTTKITAQSYAGLVNLIYLRHLGRYPESTAAVNGNVTDLLAGTKTLEQLDSEVYASPEAQSYREGGVSYRRANIFVLDGSFSQTVTGTIVYDSRDEGSPGGDIETANVTVRLGSQLGPIIANCDIGFTDTSTIHGDMFPVPIDLVPGFVHTMSFVSIGTRFANEPMKIKVFAPDGTGAAIGATNFTITAGTWTQPTTNTHIQTFTIKVNDGYTSFNSSEYFKLGAHVGVAESLFVGTANIRVLPNPAIGFTTTSTTTTTTIAPTDWSTIITVFGNGPSPGNDRAIRFTSMTGITRVVVKARIELGSSIVGKNYDTIDIANAYNESTIHDIPGGGYTLEQLSPVSLDGISNMLIDARENYISAGGAVVGFRIEVYTSAGGPTTPAFVSSPTSNPPDYLIVGGNA